MVQTDETQGTEGEERGKGSKGQRARKRETRPQIRMYTNIIIYYCCYIKEHVYEM